MTAPVISAISFFFQFDAYVDNWEKIPKSMSDLS